MTIQEQQERFGERMETRMIPPPFITISTITVVSGERERGWNEEIKGRRVRPDDVHIPGRNVLAPCCGDCCYYSNLI